MSLASYVDAWEDTAGRLTGLGRSLAAGDWTRPTDLAGGAGKDVFAHLAAVESELIGEPPPEIELPATATHVRNVFGAHMERGVERRRGRTGAEIVDEFARCVAVRVAALH